jgi:hypothetical protein
MNTFWKIVVGVLALVGAVFLIESFSTWKVHHDTPAECRQYIGHPSETMSDYCTEWWDNYQSDPGTN